MWKCKECGGTLFDAEFHTKITVNIDKQKKITPEEELEADYFECLRCGIDGDDIEDIADWVEGGKNER
ncbi:hypothetical protein [Fusobacterium necrophorum]|uniref:hypothetical protein n=1 Tax=Fusobacterium necrophorum TaxID=859 RepID=UPI003F9F5FEB